MVYLGGTHPIVDAMMRSLTEYADRQGRLDIPGERMGKEFAGLKAVGDRLFDLQIVKPVSHKCLWAGGQLVSNKGFRAGYQN